MLTNEGIDYLNMDVIFKEFISFKCIHCIE